MSGSIPPVPEFPLSTLKPWLVQVGQALGAIAPPATPASEQQAPALHALHTLSTKLREDNARVFQNAQLNYVSLGLTPFNAEFATLLRTSSNTQLRAYLASAELEPLAPWPTRKAFMLHAWQEALENEVRLKVSDRLLAPGDHKLIDDLQLDPPHRPGIYAMTFTWQQRTLEFAGAFVATTAPTPVDSLDSPVDVGPVLLFTPARGLESFATLALLDAHLRQCMASPGSRAELMGMVARAYQALEPAGIWPVVLAPITDKPLAEHLYDALRTRQQLDIDYALGFDANPPTASPQAIKYEFDRAVASAQLDLGPRLELRAQQLLERLLRHSVPDWYRSANLEQRETVARRVEAYNRARTHLVSTLGLALSPHTLAEAQLSEHLERDLEIDDLALDQVRVTTERTISGVGSYEHSLNLLELALNGLHAGDEHADSDFLKHTRITYNGHALAEEYAALTPAYLAKLLASLQPRIDFKRLQVQVLSTQQAKSALQAVLDKRWALLAYTAHLQNHISAADYQLISSPDVPAGTTLSAHTLQLHGSALKDLCVLRHTDAQGEVLRVLLCTPEAPRDEQFQGFDSDQACKAHILGWSLDRAGNTGTPGMRGYLLGQVLTRVRPEWEKMLDTLSFKPADQEYRKISFSAPLSHDGCLEAMASVQLTMQVDEYAHAVPGWFSEATAQERQKYTRLTQDAKGAAQAYDATPGSIAQWVSFDTYVHQQAKPILNRLLGNPTPEVDPDQIKVITRDGIYSFTTLYRNGYDKNFAFYFPWKTYIKRFMGPPGVDLGRLTAENVIAPLDKRSLAVDYINLIDSTLLDRADKHYNARRNAALALRQLHMKAAAHAARMQGVLTRTDQAWLELSIDKLGDERLATRAAYPVFPLRMFDEFVEGCFLFQFGSEPRLLYTPDAPDGIDFRLAREFNERVKNVDGMVQYYVDRVAYKERAVFARRLLERKEQMLPQRRGLYTTPFFDPISKSTPPLTSMRGYCYDLKIELLINEVKDTTLSQGQRNLKLAGFMAELFVSAITAPFPILSLLTGVVLALKDSVIALHHYNRGETSEALSAYIGAVLNLGGAFLTDLRPVLKSIKVGAQVTRPLRQVVRTAADEQAMTLIKQMDGPPATFVDMQPVRYGERSLWTSLQPNSQGHYLLFRYDAARGELLSTGILADRTADGRWLRSRFAGGAPEQVTDLGKYEWPTREKCILRSVVDAQYSVADDYNLGVPPGFDHLSSRPYRLRFQTLAETLSTDSDAFFKSLDPVIPRVETPVPSPDLSARALLEMGFAEAEEVNGLVFGAAHDSLAFKQWLIDNMASVEASQVKVIYIEHLLSDIHGEKLKGFLTEPHISRNIKQHLSKLDDNIPSRAKDPQGEYTFYQLLKKAREHKIQVQAIGVSTAYDFDTALGYRLFDDVKNLPNRQQMKVFYAHKAINAHGAKKPGVRWIALVDHSRMSTCNHVPGIADLQKTLAIRIEDVALGQPTGLWPDVPGSIAGDPLAKADLRLALHTSYRAPEVAGPSGVQVAPQRFSKFDLPEVYKDVYQDYSLAPEVPGSFFGGINYPHSSAERVAARAFKTTQEQLEKEAQLFLRNRVPSPRVELPVIDTHLEARAFYHHSYEKAAGLIMAAERTDDAVRTLLINDMQYLADTLEVRVLYLEGLTTDLHQAGLNELHVFKRMPSRLKAYLEHLDARQDLAAQNLGSYVTLVQTAAKHGVMVRALSCLASLRNEGKAHLRGTLMNYFAYQTISGYQAKEAANRWIALVSSPHANTYKSVPGLADLTQAVSLEVRGVPPLQAKGVHPGPRYMGPDSQGDLVSIKLDFRLDRPVVGRVQPAPARPYDRSRLKQVGDFTLEQVSETEARLLHVSRTGEVLETPVQTDAGGLFFIERWELDAYRFKTQKELWISLPQLRRGLKYVP